VGLVIALNIDPGIPFSHYTAYRPSWAHTVFGNSKTWLRGTFRGISPKHLPRYLDEFVFRFDRRWRETEFFLRVMHRD
jgi:hypothetical protein